MHVRELQPVNVAARDMRHSIKVKMKWKRKRAMKWTPLKPRIQAYTYICDILTNSVKYYSIDEFELNFWGGQHIFDFFLTSFITYYLQFYKRMYVHIVFRVYQKCHLLVDCWIGNRLLCILDLHYNVSKVLIDRHLTTWLHL